MKKKESKKKIISKIDILYFINFLYKAKFLNYKPKCNKVTSVTENASNVNKFSTETFSITDILSVRETKYPLCRE